MNELSNKSNEAVLNRLPAGVVANVVLDIIEHAVQRARHWSERTLPDRPRSEPLHAMTEAQEIAARNAVGELAATLTRVLDLAKTGDSQVLEPLGDCAPPAEIDLKVIAVNVAFAAAAQRTVRRRSRRNIREVGGCFAGVIVQPVFKLLEHHAASRRRGSRTSNNVIQSNFR